MKQKWHYPDMDEIRSRAKLVATVLQGLADDGIEALTIDLKPEAPVIEVMHSHSTRHLFGVDIGKERVSADQVLIKKSARVCGCKVIWSEMI